MSETKVARRWSLRIYALTPAGPFANGRREVGREVYRRACTTLESAKGWALGYVRRALADHPYGLGCVIYDDRERRHQRANVLSRGRIAWGPA